MQICLNFESFCRRLQATFYNDENQLEETDLRRLKRRLINDGIWNILESGNISSSFCGLNLKCEEWWIKMIYKISNNLTCRQINCNRARRMRRKKLKHKGLMFISSNVNCSLNNLVNKVFSYRYWNAIQHTRYTLCAITFKP